MPCIFHLFVVILDLSLVIFNSLCCCFLSMGSFCVYARSSYVCFWLFFLTVYGNFVCLFQSSLFLWDCFALFMVILHDVTEWSGMKY